ncbi:hypothetical protein [Streptomyces sp. NPDC054863]
MTRTAATLLVGVAVTAVSGCVSTPSGPAGKPAAHQQSPAPQHPPLPHLVGDGGQPEQLIEAPVHEVLEAAMPPSARAPAPKAEPAGEQGATRAPQPQPPRAERPDRRAAVPEPEPPHRHRAPHRKKDPLPALPKVPTSAADVCALGKGYGGWRPNSPEARICRETYGG